MCKTSTKVVFAACFVAVSSNVSAITFSEANIHFGGLLPTETVGGLNEVEAEISNSGSDVVMQASRDYSASSYGSSLNRRASFDISSSISVPSEAPSAVLTAPVEARNRVLDTINIGAGGSFIEGDFIQILLQVQFDAIVQQEGRPSGAMQGDFELRANSGTNANDLLIDYTTGALNPPQSFTYNNYWEFLVDATVGDVVTYDSYMRGTINGTAFDQGLSGTNLMNFDATITFSHAPGYEDLILTADSGAPISPIPIPAAVWLFGSGLFGLIGVARRKQA
jgi:hypothetical protein